MPKQVFIFPDKVEHTTAEKLYIAAYRYKSTQYILANPKLVESRTAAELTVSPNAPHKHRVPVAASSQWTQKSDAGPSRRRQGRQRHELAGPTTPHRDRAGGRLSVVSCFLMFTHRHKLVCGHKEGCTQSTPVPLERKGKGGVQNPPVFTAAC